MAWLTAILEQYVMPLVRRIDAMRDKDESYCCEEPQLSEALEEWLALPSLPPSLSHVMRLKIASALRLYGMFEQDFDMIAADIERILFAEERPGLLPTPVQKPLEPLKKRKQTSKVIAKTKRHKLKESVQETVVIVEESDESSEESGVESDDSTESSESSDSSDSDSSSSESETKKIGELDDLEQVAEEISSEVSSDEQNDNYAVSFSAPTSRPAKRARSEELYIDLQKYTKRIKREQKEINQERNRVEQMEREQRLIDREAALFDELEKLERQQVEQQQAEEQQAEEQQAEKQERRQNRISKRFLEAQKRTREQIDERLKNIESVLHHLCENCNNENTTYYTSTNPNTIVVECLDCSYSFSKTVKTTEAEKQPEESEIENDDTDEETVLLTKKRRQNEEKDDFTFQNRDDLYDPEKETSDNDNDDDEK